jgi:hypothetical protein
MRHAPLTTNMPSVIFGRAFEKSGLRHGALLHLGENQEPRVLGTGKVVVSGSSNVVTAAKAPASACRSDAGSNVTRRASIAVHSHDGLKKTAPVERFSNRLESSAPAQVIQTDSREGCPKEGAA